MDEKKMLKEDMDAMSYEEALDLLRFDLAMRTFDATTGETDSLFRLKNSGNKENYPVYVAISKCISLLESFADDEGYNKRLKTTYIIPKCERCDTIIRDVMITTSNFERPGGYLVPIRGIEPSMCPNCGTMFDEVVVDKIRKTVIVKGKNYD